MRGRIDAVINCVGVIHTGPAFDLDLARCRKTLDLNLAAAFVLSRAKARAIEDTGGRIFNVASFRAALLIQTMLHTLAQRQVLCQSAPNFDP